MALNAAAANSAPVNVSHSTLISPVSAAMMGAGVGGSAVNSTNGKDNVIADVDKPLIKRARKSWLDLCLLLARFDNPKHMRRIGR